VRPIDGAEQGPSAGGAEIGVAIVSGNWPSSEPKA